MWWFFLKEKPFELSFMSFFQIKIEYKIHGMDCPLSPCLFECLKCLAILKKSTLGSNYCIMGSWNIYFLKAQAPRYATVYIPELERRLV